MDTALIYGFSGSHKKEIVKFHTLGVYQPGKVFLRCEQVGGVLVLSSQRRLSRTLRTHEPVARGYGGASSLQSYP